MYSTKSSTPQHWPIDYLSYLQHFQSQTNRQESLLVHLYRGLPLPPTLKRLIEENNLAVHYRTRAPMADWEDEDDPNDGSGLKLGINVLGHLNIDIHRELTWTLCSPALEQLKSMVIPLSDIGKYLEAVPRMSSLVSVTFKLDEVANVPAWWNEELSEEVMAKVALVQAKRIQNLESAVEFVRFHTLLYPGTLTNIYCPNDYANVGSIGQTCPPSVLQRMLATPLARSRPMELNNENWKQFVARVKETDLSRVALVNVHGRDTEWYYQLKVTPFLHRCTALEAYHMMSLGPDTFKWAVEKDGVLLPPLKAVHIQAVKEPFGSELEDLGLGFGKTLKVLKATGFGVQANGFNQQDPFMVNGGLETDGIVQTVAIGCGWKMPVLTHLAVIMISERLTLDSSVLIHCPVLQRLELRDRIGSYDIHEIQTWKPSKLPELVKIFLSGTPALAFHPDTLHSTLALKTLALGSPASISHAFLPSVYNSLGEDLDLGADKAQPMERVPRPHWDWDWFLPQLETLDLSIEFALHFQFRMLQGTPILQELRLTILSTHTPVERILTDSDFVIVPGPFSTHAGESTSAFVGESSSSSSDQRGSSLPKTVVPSSLSRLPRKELHALYWHISELQAAMEEQQLAMERPKQEPDQQQDVLEQTYLPVPVLDNVQLVQQRLGHLSRHQDEQTGLYSSWPHNPQQLYDLRLGLLQGMVESQPVLQQELERLLVAREGYYVKKDNEVDRAVERQAKRPDRLVVPSLRSLELNGTWHISDRVLDFLLGEVFLSLETVDLFGCVGFSSETWIGATAGMPFLENATLSRALEVEIAAAYGMARCVASHRKGAPLFESNTRRRLAYTFLDGEYVFKA